MEDLTPKQQRFAEEYLKDLNARQAAIRAGYSEATAQEQGSRLLSNVKVKAAVAMGQEKLSERVQIDQQWVLDNLIKIHEKCAESTNKESASLKALEMIGKHLGMFAERVKLSNDEDKPFMTKIVHSVNERIAQMLEKE